MKVGPGQLARFLAKPDPRVRAVLVYGPDQGAVRERADTVMRWAVSDLADPFRVSEFAGPTLRSDPARLIDALLARALTGGRRCVRVREGSDALAESLREAIAALGGGDRGDEATLLVVEGGELGPRSGLRMLFERAESGAALPCYVDEPEAIVALVRQGLAADHVSIDADALAWVVDRLGIDRSATRSEIEKLALFAGPGGRIGLDDAIALASDGGASTIDAIAFKAGAGDASGLERLFARALGEGTSAIAILRGVARHFERLHLVGGGMEAGRSADVAMAALRPPLFFKLRDSFRMQLRRWPPEAAAAALRRLAEAEMACKTGGAPEAAISGEALLAIACGAVSGALRH